VQGESDTRPQDAGNLLTLAHPSLEAGSDPFWLSASEEAAFLASNCHRDHRDPASFSNPAYAELWTACWAAVEGSDVEPEFYVVYQQRQRGGLPSLWAAVWFALAAMLIALSVQYLRREVRNRG
jgi:hypothetical protein